MIHDGLWSTFTGQHMGESSDEVNDALGISRERQDAWAARSHSGAAAWAAGRVAEEIIGVEVTATSGEPSRSWTPTRASGPTRQPESLAQLPPAFGPRGRSRPGNASQLSDGAAALVVMSAERAEALGVEPLAEIVSHGMCAERFAYLHTVPAIALQKALDEGRPGGATTSG